MHRDGAVRDYVTAALKWWKVWLASGVVAFFIAVAPIAHVPISAWFVPVFIGLGAVISPYAGYQRVRDQRDEIEAAGDVTLGRLERAQQTRRKTKTRLIAANAQNQALRDQLARPSVQLGPNYFGTVPPQAIPGSQSAGAPTVAIDTTLAPDDPDDADENAS